VPARKAEGNIKGDAYTLDVGLLMYTLKDKRIKQTSVKEPKL
jgi:hypothetical protein